MELLFRPTVVLATILILQNLDFGISENVKVKGHVLTLPQQKNENFRDLEQLWPTVIEQENEVRDRLTNHEIPLGENSDKTLVVKCVQDNNKAKAFVYYGQEEFLIDIVNIFDSKDICNQLGDYIYVRTAPRWNQNDGNDELSFVILYKFDGETPQCVTRVYTLVTYLDYAKLQRELKLRTYCKGQAVIDSGTVDSKIDGCLTSSGTYEVMNFNKDLKPSEEPTSHIIQDESNLKLVCQIYNNPDSTAEDSIIAKGFITYGDVIIEKLSLDTCTDGIEGMYIGTVEIDPLYEKEFILVFKTTDKKCYKMYIRYSFVESRDKIKISRDAPEGVNCPEDWTRKAALEVKAPWYKRVLSSHSIDRLRSSEERTNRNRMMSKQSKSFS